MQAFYRQYYVENTGFHHDLVDLVGEVKAASVAPYVKLIHLELLIQLI